jgi:hypothetical protein
MNLRLLLRASGVSARDLDEALASSREVTRYAALGAKMIASGLQHATPKLKSEMAREIARKGAFLAVKIQDGAETMLGGRDPSPKVMARCPNCGRDAHGGTCSKKLGKKSQKITVQIVEKKR